MTTERPVRPPACTKTMDGRHCFHDIPTFTLDVDPPEGGWPRLQQCKHCGMKRSRVVTVSYEYPPWETES